MIDINNLTSFALDKEFFTGVAKKVLKGENKEIKNLSIAFVEPLEIKKLNKKYRKKDKPTDVLSFGEGEGLTGNSDILEIIICPKVAKENAEKFGNSFNAEITKLLIHGILHLLGYDHERSEQEAVEMENKEKFYLSKIKINV